MNSDREIHPRQFANHVIKQMAAHMLADDMVVEYNDFMVIRIAFRSCGGKWSEICAGDMDQLELLKNVVTAWGNMPGRKHAGDEVI
jgi:hypothetical protein